MERIISSKFNKFTRISKKQARIVRGGVDAVLVPAPKPGATKYVSTKTGWTVTDEYYYDTKGELLYRIVDMRP